MLLAGLLFSAQTLVSAPLLTLYFDETTAPANGLTQQGVLFHFDFGNAPSQDAVYGAAYPYSDQLLQDFVLSGPAQDSNDPSRSGSLTFTFLQPTDVLNFAVALTTGAPDAVALTLYDTLGNSLTPVSIATAYDSVNCDPNSQICPSEAEYSYSGSTPLSGATLSFAGTNVDDFAVDNLQYDELPEPSSFSTLLLGAAVLIAGWKTRVLIARHRLRKM